MRKNWTRYLIGFAALALGLASMPAAAHCDFFTGGGFIIRDSADKGTFGVGGGCKNGELWGHLEYHDHGSGLDVHWLTLTAYFTMGTDSGAENDPKRTGTRALCGTARTNLYGDVDFALRVTDNGEPGDDDEFVIQLRKNGDIVYTTVFDSDHSLGGSGSGGGNIQLHKPNPSTADFFTSTPTCPGA
jgi:hypothetical protein